MDTGAVLGALGAITAVGTLLFTTNAWRTERRDRLAEMAAERDARESQLAIELERFEAEREERELMRHADITATQLPHQRRGGSRVYRVRLRNMGPSYSKHVTAWLVDETGTPQSSRPAGRPLAKEERAVLSLQLRDTLWDDPVPLRLMVEWFNDRGTPEQELSNMKVTLD